MCLMFQVGNLLVQIYKINLDIELSFCFQQSKEKPNVWIINKTIMDAKPIKVILYERCLKRAC